MNWKKAKATKAQRAKILGLAEELEFDLKKYTSHIETAYELTNFFTDLTKGQANEIIQNLLKLKKKKNS